MSVQVSQIGYRPMEAPYVPRYVYSKLTPNAGSGNLVVTTSQQEIIFDLPSRCINFARSYLAFSTSVAAHGTGANFMFNDSIVAVNKVQLSSRGGIFMCDTNSTEHYSQITLKERETSKIPIYESDTANVTFGSAQNNATVDLHYDGTGSYTLQRDEPQYYTVGAVTTAGPNQARVIPLGDFADTILALDKDMPMNEITQLRFVLNPRDFWGHGAAAVTNAGGTPSALAGNITLSAITLYLAIESNPSITEELYRRVNSSGFNTVIPWVYSFKTAESGTATSRTVSVKMNRTHGMYLQKIYHVPYNAVEATNTRYSHVDTNITSFLTLVDNERRQPYDPILANGDDWLLIKDDLEGTMLGSRRDRYRRNWYVRDCFDGCLGDNKDAVVNAGLPLDNERKVECTINNAATATQYNIYSFAVTTRNLVISSNGIIVM